MRRTIKPGLDAEAEQPAHGQRPVAGGPSTPMHTALFVALLLVGGYTTLAWLGVRAHASSFIDDKQLSAMDRRNNPRFGAVVEQPVASESPITRDPSTTTYPIGESEELARAGGGGCYYALRMAKLARLSVLVTLLCAFACGTSSTTQSCDTATADKICVLYADLPASTAASLADACTKANGTVGTNCPRQNLLGSCPGSDPGGIPVVYYFYSSEQDPSLRQAAAAQRENACIASMNTWSAP